MLTNDWKLAESGVYVLQDVSTQPEFDPGDLISIVTSREISIGVVNEKSLSMIVLDSASTRIKGRIGGFLSYVDETMKSAIDTEVAIMRGDIEYAWIKQDREIFEKQAELE